MAILHTHMIANNSNNNNNNSNNNNNNNNNNNKKKKNNNNKSNDDNDNDNIYHYYCFDLSIWLSLFPSETPYRFDVRAQRRKWQMKTGVLVLRSHRSS